MRDKVIVGVNDFVQEDETPIPILYIDESTAERQLSRLGSQEDPRQREGAPFPRGAQRDRPRHREYDMPAARLRPRLRHGRRNVRRAAKVWGEYEEVPLI